MNRKLWFLPIFFYCALAPALAAQDTPLALVLTPLADQLEEPVGIASAGDERLFIVEKRGLISIWNGRLFAQPFLDIRDRVLYTGEVRSELGLLSAAFHPRYPQNGFFFVTYVDQNGDSVISRFSVSGDPDRADAGSERILLRVPQPGENHNVNHLQFGPDGFLYVASGEGGFLREPRCTGQETGNLLGKILRLDVDQNVDTPPYHGIPASNPFVGPGEPLDEIWALGLRNAWRFSFDRTTGDLFIADVGQSLREEINLEPAASPGGRNYGFKMMEGTVCRGIADGCPQPVPPCGDPAYTDPIFDYPHDDRHCAIIGGHVYRGSNIPALFGRYLFGDFCGAFGLLTETPSGWTHLPLFGDLPGLVAFGEDADGELVLVDGSTLYRVEDVIEASAIAFASSLFETREDAGEAIIVLERGGGADGAVTVEVATRGESARAGLDYTEVRAQVSWADGDGTSKRVTVPILQDDLVEGSETLALELSLVEGLGTASGEARLTIVDDDLPEGDCVADANTLCLNSGRFLVQTTWRTPDDRTGRGRAQQLTDESGTFWFFSPTNIEVVVKVLRGCFDPFNHYWVFAAGLTNVEVEMTVIDTATDLLKRYDNPLGRPFPPIQDTRAFATCP